MKRKTYFNALSALLLLLSSLYYPLSAQTREQKLEATIRRNDSLFWHAYNNCDTLKLRQYFTNDIEFYHDKGGLTLGKDNLMTSIKKNLCMGNFRLRREVIAGSLKIFTLEKEEIPYGAIISGDHLFYLLEQGKKERLDGQAKFTEIWVIKEGEWKISRILSYDHGAAPYINTRKEVKISPRILNQYIGKYEGPITGTLSIQTEQKSLILVVKGKKFYLYPSSESLFFFRDRDLTFEFVKDEQGQFFKMIVKENGENSEVLKSVK